MSKRAQDTSAQESDGGSLCRYILKPCAAVLVVVIVSGIAGAKEADLSLQRQVDEIFSPYSKLDTPGCALGIVQNNQLTYARGYGAASLELGVPITTKSIFDLASVSKQFTAASVVLAAEQGHLSLDDDIHKYIPELPDYGHKITLRQMLNHTSGLRDMNELMFLSGGYPEVDIHSDGEFLDLLARQRGLNNVPGAEWIYSNTNYFLMAFVIKRTTGKSLAQYADEQIFKPLGMTHTHFHDDRQEVVPGMVSAYSSGAKGGFRLDTSTNDASVGHSGLTSSVEDLVLWDRNFYANKLGHGALLRELQTPGVLNDGEAIHYGLGLELFNYRGQPTVEHNGGIRGFRTELLRFPTQRFSVILLCNVSALDTINLASRIADLYLAKDLAPAAHALHVDPHPFVGDYRDPESHAVLSLSAAHGDLVEDDERFQAVTPLEFDSDTAFEGFESLKFEPNESPHATVTVTYPDAPPRRYERFVPIKLTVAELEQYAGVYSSPELPATYRFSVKDGHLDLTINWRELTDLSPTVRDEFHESALNNVTITFHRKSGGAVDGFELYQYRARHMGKFTRVGG